MKKIKVQQTKVINAVSAEDYEEQFNSAMWNLATKSPTFKQNEANPLLAFIYYFEESDPIPETIQDEFIIAGRRMQCGNCPYFFMQEDKRMKARCLLHHWIVTAERECCTDYLEEVKASEGGVIQ